VDVVMPASYAGSGGELDPERMEQQLADMIPQEHRDFIERVLGEYEVPPLNEDEVRSGLLGWTHEGARPQVEIALAHPTRLLVNALGPPPKDVVDLAHDHDVRVAALVGSLAHAERQVNQGVDMIVAQGYEAGGHTGDVAGMVLVPEVVDAVGDRVPVLAAGGIGSGRQMAAAMALGADGVWTGSIWLTTAESDTVPAVIDRLLAAGSRDTVRSRALTGKPARQLRTAWTDAWERPDSPGYLPMPLQYMATADAQRRIAKYSVDELRVMPVGQIVGRMQSVRPVRDVVLDLMDEFIDATQRLDTLRDEE
jgi:NAD(P)H-dependent flavin oxidoreductase YrpB (nitropropane dioxygenase family)